MKPRGIINWWCLARFLLQLSLLGYIWRHRCPVFRLVQLPVLVSCLAAHSPPLDLWSSPPWLPLLWDLLVGLLVRCVSFSSLPSSWIPNVCLVILYLYTGLFGRIGPGWLDLDGLRRRMCWTQVLCTIVIFMTQPQEYHWVRLVTCNCASLALLL